MFKSFSTKFTSRNSSHSSFAPLNPSSSKQDPERIFGELASTYGFNAGVPSLPPKNSSPSTKSSRRQSSHTSTVVLPSPSAKNYEQSYGDLVSTYGFGAGVPCLPPTQKQSKSTTKTSTHSPTPPPYVNQPPSSSQKNYELAFGELSSSYGFGGPLPSLPKSK